MGTVVSSGFKFLLHNLDTFKDIWGPLSLSVGLVSNAEFRYLQGYMGTHLFSISPMISLKYLDTFKDIWGHTRLFRERSTKQRFRYLQGYMGTPFVRGLGVLHLRVFRYLQGYMGTKIEDRRGCLNILFRYLQGYMGTRRSCNWNPSPSLFRYLQGYMGTLLMNAVLKFL